MKISSVALKTVLSIGKQKECLYKEVCNGHIECKVEKVPFCELEKMFYEKIVPKELLDKLKNHTLTSMLSKIEKRLDKTNGSVVLFNEVNDFTCPFFRTKGQCKFSLCQYFSKSVINTNCILSIRKEVGSSEIAVAKNISKEELFKIILGLKIGPGWNKIISMMDRLNNENYCSMCGHLLDVCKETPSMCSKRQKYSIAFKNKNIFPTGVNKYPLLLIIMCISKLNPNFIKLFPKELLTLYLKPIGGKYE